MSVNLKATHYLRPLARRLANEGAVLDPGGVSIVEQPPLPQELVRVTLGARDELVPALWAVRWWSGDEWLPQAWAVLSTTHLFEGDRGPDVGGGFTLKPSGFLAGLGMWCIPIVLAVVRRLAHTGPLSFGLSLPDLTPCGLVLGAVEWSLYGLLEGLKGSVEGQWTNPQPLKESWVCGVLITRAPFPYHLDGPRVTHPVSPPLEKHYWLYDTTPFASVVTTTSTILGVVTAWGAASAQVPSMHPLKEAARRVARTAGGLHYPLVQYRGDLFQWSIPQWESLAQLGV